ncbi:MAG: GNAT family N-acetyltransferase [Flavobacteriales bacterium]|nr:GNAT family N-acetyltransferase [Flavobacteriales bacterium]
MIKIERTNDHITLSKLNEEIQTFHHNIHPNIFKPYDHEAVLNFFKNTLSSEKAIAFVAKENETTIGYLLLFTIHFADNPFQYARQFILLDQILVLKNHQGKGVGKQLLDAALAFAKEQNIETIELNHWTQNESARKFFGKNKFEYFNEKMWRAVE